MVLMAVPILLLVPAMSPCAKLPEIPGIMAEDMAEAMAMGDIGYLLGLAAEQAVLCVSLGFCEAFYMLHNPRIYSKVERSIKVIDKGAQDDRRHHGNDDFVNLTGG